MAEILSLPPSEASELLARAAALCARSGHATPVSGEHLAGGRNNRVFRLRLADGTDVVLKWYFRDAHDNRDRLEAEWNFLTYAWARGIRCVPQPLAYDRSARLGLYGFVGGDKLAPEQVTGDRVRAAADFVSSLNAAPRQRSRLKPGSESCFSIADHLERVDRRIERLGRIEPQVPHAEAAVGWIADTLKPRWHDVRTGILDASSSAGLGVEAPIPEREIIASPSDFGFHNMLWHEVHGLRFLDFEYAGWDDPAKLAGDFFGCPEVPTPSEYFGLFVETLDRGLGLGANACRRMRMLRNAYLVKWACIVLNDFLPDHDARRRFAGPGDRSERCAAQLDKASALIAATETA